MSRHRWRRFTLAMTVAAFPASSHAQSMRLQIHPQAGDTLRTRLDQRSEMIGRRRAGSTETTTSVVASMKLFSRTIVEGSTPTESLVLAVADSVLFSSSDPQASAMNEQAQRLLPGQQIRLRLALDGTAQMMDAAGPRRDLSGGLISLVPAALPTMPVMVGESWTREMALPTPGEFGRPTDGTLHATFRLDSVSRSRDLAYISMRGEVTPADSAPRSRPGPTVHKGTVSGGMVLDRRRGWLVDSRFWVVVHADVVPPASSGVASIHFQTRITQHIHTMDKR